MSLPAVFHEAYEVDIGPHVFPTAKYRLVRDRLLERGVLGAADLHRPEPATDAELRLVHTEAWIRKLEDGELTLQERWRLEVPWSEALVRASRLCAGGTTLAGRLAREAGAALHLGGGFHHAFPDHGEGFCALNDVAIAVRVLLEGGEIDRALVVDLDVHHGNGTAAIFADDARVFTLSFHQERNYPAVKPPGDLDVGLPDGTDDDAYLSRLERRLPEAVSRSRPDLAVYLAGADPYREDQLGGLGLSREGLRRRDRRTLEVLAGASVPTAVCLAGGYAVDTEDTVEIHCATAEEARRITDGGAAGGA